MTVHRIEVHPGPGQDDPRGESVQRDARSALGCDIAAVRTASVYLIEADLSSRQLQTIAGDVLSDAVAQIPMIGVRTPDRGSRLVEVHPLPGVMDPAAQSVELAIRELFGIEASVRTGTRFDLFGIDDAAADRVANRLLANATVQAVYRQPHCPAEFSKGHEQALIVREVALLDLDDEGLTRLSRDGHLFLSLDEMKAIQAEYRRLGREPRDVELETLAQTWSEHCVHKTLKSTIRYTGELPGAANRPGHVVNADGSITIHNLLKSTVAAATHELMADGIDWCLSVFVDNAGVIAFDEDTAVCFKVETHNHPSALEPYGGAATGIGGCIRDVIGTGLAARPIAATDIFCVAYPDSFTGETLPTGCLHPQRVLSRVVAGVRDYGNRMGIPTVNGGVSFDDRYVGNPLVYCGCVGVMPRDMVRGAAQAGDHIIALGGATGRDGIHGATFSSAELTDSHADEFSHAVQIGNPITEKKLLDVILQARDHAGGCLFSGITDCGAGGFSSAVGEMGEQLGATVHLERAPIKYAGLTYTEIWISEAQERMVLSVPEANLETLRTMCEIEGVEMCDLGTFGTPDRELILTYGGTEVGRLSMEFMHEGIPTPTREAEWRGATSGAGVSPARTRAHGESRASTNARDARSISQMLLELLAHPNIASKHWIIRQYDHEVQGQTVIKPLTGVHDDGPSDAAVLTPKLDSTRGLALANGLATGLAADAYWMTLAAIDECVRNLVCVGTDPARVAILDNFCWPSCKKASNLGSLVRAAEACYDGAKAYGTPFISGKDSLNNQFTTESGETIEIPPTLLISGFGIVPDVRRCVTMDLKRVGNRLIVVGVTGPEMGGSHWSMITGQVGINGSLPHVDLNTGPQFAAIVAELIRSGLVRAAHDCSEGGLLVAAAEMALAGDLGLALDIEASPAEVDVDLAARLFAESPSRYLLEVQGRHLGTVERLLGDLPFAMIGEVNDSGHLRVDAAEVDIEIDVLRRAWQGTLDW